MGSGLSSAPRVVHSADDHKFWRRMSNDLSSKREDPAFDDVTTSEEVTTPKCGVPAQRGAMIAADETKRGEISEPIPLQVGPPIQCIETKHDNDSENKVTKRRDPELVKASYRKNSIGDTNSGWRSIDIFEMLEDTTLGGRGGSQSFKIRASERGTAIFDMKGRSHRLRRATKSESSPVRRKSMVLKPLPKRSRDKFAVGWKSIPLSEMIEGLV